MKSIIYLIAAGRRYSGYARMCLDSLLTIGQWSGELAVFTDTPDAFIGLDAVSVKQRNIRKHESQISRAVFGLELADCDFDRITYLDCDHLAHRNIEWINDLPSLSAMKEYDGTARRATSHNCYATDAELDAPFAAWNSGFLSGTPVDMANAFRQWILTHEAPVLRGNEWWREQSAFNSIVNRGVIPVAVVNHQMLSWCGRPSLKHYIAGAKEEMSRDYAKLMNADTESMMKIIGIDSRNQFPELLKSLDLTVRGAEIGVQRGHFSGQLIRVITEKLYLVDGWKNIAGYRDIANVSDADHQANYEAVNRAFSENPKVKIVRLESSDAASTIEDGSLDFVYIDADHSQSGCSRDISLWYPKVRPGGILCGHDYLDGIRSQGVFGVKTAVDSFVASVGATLYVTPEEWPTWYFLKQ